MERGYVKLWRKTLDSGLLANGPACQLFHYLLLNTTHKPYRKIVGGMTFDLQPGDVVFGRKRAADDLNLSEKQVRTALKLLEKLEIVASNPTNKCTVISFVNWGTYQDSRPAEGPTEGQQGASTGPTEGQQGASTGPTEGQQGATRQEHNTKNREHNTEEENIGASGEQLPVQQLVLVPEEKPKKKAKKDLLENLSPILKEAMQDFIEFRKSIRKPMSDVAITRALNKLTELFGDDDHRKKASIDQSILSGWSGLFELKDDRRTTPQGRTDGRVGYIQDRPRDFAHEAANRPF